jgi:diguanylate cyclase (GGDEF)-like protein
VAFALIAAWTDTVGDLARAVAFAHPFLPVWDFAAKAGVYAISVVVLAELHDALARERELARTDMLTGVANRRAFFEQATQEIERSLRYNRPFSVAVLDVDDFKQVNDRFGHGAGDVVLRAVAGAIHLNTRALDLVARLGGDEFGVILPETTAEASEAMVGKLRAVLQQAMREQAHPVTVSIGLVTFDAPPATADELVRRADALMYQVKRTGKNQLKHEVVTW